MFLKEAELNTIFQLLTKKCGELDVLCRCLEVDLKLTLINRYLLFFITFLLMFVMFWR